MNLLHSSWLELENQFQKSAPFSEERIRVVAAAWIRYPDMILEHTVNSPTQGWTSPLARACARAFQSV